MDENIERKTIALIKMSIYSPYVGPFFKIKPLTGPASSLTYTLYNLDNISDKNVRN